MTRKNVVIRDKILVDGACHPGDGGRVGALMIRGQTGLSFERVTSVVELQKYNSNSLYH
jgi:hypothetical protein